MRIEVAEDPGEIGAARIRVAIESGGVRTLGLATGSSVESTYRALARFPHAIFADLTLFALDEYVGLAPGDQRSYRSVLGRQFLAPLGLPSESLLVPDVHAPDLATACSDYEALIRTKGGIGLQILGIGTNGHIAFNEPPASPSSRTRVITLDAQTRADNARFFESPDTVPTLGVTQGIGTILEATRIVLIATGARKAPAIAAAVEGPVSPLCPASALQLHSDVTLVLDRDAASLVRPAG